jgi:hypothetical protein
MQDVPDSNRGPAPAASSGGTGHPPRGCYCGLWLTSPETLEAQGVPRDHCGICDRCSSPGHMRHAPGGAPYTGAWCDRCFRIVTIQNYSKWAAFFAVVLAAILMGRWAVGT